VDQRGQAGGEDDAAELPSVPVKRSAALLSLIAYNLGNLCGGWCCRRDRQLVAHQLAATAGEDGRKAGETRSVLLVLLEESHLTRRLFGAILGRITALPFPAG